MPLEHILAAIREDGDAELAALEAASRERERALAAAARREAEAAVEAALQAHRAQTVLAVRRIEGAANADAARVLGDAREHVFQEMLGRVRQRLGQARAAPDWPDTLRALIAEARAALPDETRVHIDPRDRPFLGDLVDDLDVLDTLVSWGGVVVQSDDGRIADNTLETRLQTAEPALRCAARDGVPTLRRSR